MKRKAKPAAPTRVYPSEKDPRQGGAWTVDDIRKFNGFDQQIDTAALARMFGRWVRDGEGRWVRR